MELMLEHMNSLTKANCLRIEDDARRAVGRMYGCCPERRRIRVGSAAAIHEFDIYSENIVIGGVSTSPLKTSGQNRNTGGTDRACRELLWLSLWSGRETRIHVLTDGMLAQWLVAQFRGIAFPHEITIFHYACAADLLRQTGTLTCRTQLSL
jgi:hypothetical protein